MNAVLKIKTGDEITAFGKGAPAWAVIDGKTGTVITVANNRRDARDYAITEDGERIARIEAIRYTVSK